MQHEQMGDQNALCYSKTVDVWATNSTVIEANQALLKVSMLLASWR